MEIAGKSIRFKGQLMSIALLIFVLLMVSSLITLVIIGVGYDGISQSSIIASSSSNYGTILAQSAKTFAYSSGTTALNVLFKYEYNVSLRKTNFITNFSQYMQYLIVNGSLPNVAKGSAAANALQSMMGNATLASYNSVVSSATGFGSKSIKVYESKPYIYQKNPYSIAIKYNEYVNINASTGSFAFTIPVNVSIPLNGTPDLFYAQQGIYRTIKPGNLNGLVSLIGNSYASSGNTLGYVYGTVYVLPYSSTCSSIPSPLNTQPYESQLIIADSNALAISGCTSYGGFISSNTISAQAMPYLSTTSTVFNYLQTGQHVLLYGPSLAILNITNLIDNVSSGAYFTSPFAPSFSQRASGNIQQQSSSGIFTLSGIANRQSAQFNSVTSYVGLPVNTEINEPITITAWVNPSTFGSSEGVYIFAADPGVRLAINPSGYPWLDSQINGGWQVSAISSVTIPSNSWSFIVGEVVGTTEYIYVNGILRGTNTISSGSVTYTASTPYVIGADNYISAPYHELFGGNIGNVQLYNTGLSPIQIYSLYQQGIEALPISSNSLVGWWPLNGNANDYSGNGYGGTANQITYGLLPHYTRDSALSGNATAAVNAIPGLANCNTMAQCNSNSIQHLYLSNVPLNLSSSDIATAQFDGQTSYINLGNSGIFDVQSLTISAWIEPTSSISGYTDEGIVSKNSASESYLLTLEQGPSYPPYISPSAFVVNSVGSEQWIVSGFTPNVFGWYNLVFTYNAVSGVESIYVNGVLQNSLTINGQLTNYAPANLVIGARNLNNGVASRVFNGRISNVQVYNAPFSASNVTTLYYRGLQGSPIFASNVVGWWPLNGNANDYSGNGNNGAPVNVVYQYISIPMPASSNTAYLVPPPGGAVNSGWQTFGFGSPP